MAEFTQQPPEMPDVSYSAYLGKDYGGGFRNFVGSIFGGYQNWANSELAKYQNSYNQWQQNYTNWYNSPENQSNLYTEAGFNKNLIASQSTGATSSPISAQVPSVQDVGKNAFSSIGSLIGLASNALGLKRQLQDIEGIRLSNESRSIENQVKRATLDASIQKTLEEAKYYKQNAFNNSAILNYQASDAQLRNIFNSEIYGVDDGFGTPAFRKYMSELSGIDLMNSIRQLQRESSAWSLSQSKKWDDLMKGLEKDILSNKSTVSGASATAIEQLSKLGVNAPIAKFLIPLILSTLKTAL